MSRPSPAVAFLLAVLAGFPLPAADLQVAPEAPPGGDGSEAKPFRDLAQALGAVKDRAAGVTIWLADGTYPVTKSIVLGAAESGRREAPLTIAARNPGKVLLTGAVRIAPEQFQPVPAEGLAEYLPAAARNQVVVADLAKTPAGAVLGTAGNRALVVCDGATLPLARWPNRGFGHIGRILDKGVIYKPGTTKGARPSSRFENPIGGEFTFQENHGGDWEREIAARIGRPSAQGYFNVDWFFENHPVARAKGTTIKLIDDSWYGVAKGEALPRRVRLTGLLSELDEPGEWFWDQAASRLYLWPLGPGKAVSLGSDLVLLRIAKGHDVVVRGLAFEGAVGGVRVEEGERVTVAGNEFRSLSGTAISIAGGKDHQVLANDLHDLDTPLQVNGSDVKARRDAGVPADHLLDSDGFVISNNHIWKCRDTRGCHVRGIGWQFTHNLIHDLPGGALAWGGNDVLIAENEFYDVMTQLGDWGVIYTGATWWTHGNVVRNNFTHHIFNIPQGHGIAGFYFDDLKQGDTTLGNVFYKVAHRTVKLGGGSAQTVVGNVFIDCHIDITTDAVVIDKMKQKRLRYESGELKRGDKEDYWGRTEEVVGKDGWTQAPWTKYPLFRQAMERDPYSPALTTFRGNCEVGTLKDAIWLNKVPDGLVTAEPVVPVKRSDFVNPEALDFRFQPGFSPLPGFAPIPFERIGLVVDAYRTTTPDKAAYRTAVRQRHGDRPCYDAKAVYDPVQDNLRLFPPPEYLPKEP